MDGNQRGDKMILELQEMVASSLITSTLDPAIKVDAKRINKLQLGKIVYLSPHSPSAFYQNDEAIVKIEDNGNIIKAYIGRWRYNNSYVSGPIRTDYYKFSNYQEVKHLTTIKSHPIYGDVFLYYTFLNTVKII